MKSLTLLVGFIASSFISIPVEDKAGLGKETLIDMIERAEYIPVYFVTKEVLYSHAFTVLGPTNTLETYITCKGVDETIPLADTYEEVYTNLVSELNRVFKTEKFVLKPATEIPLTDKQGGGMSGKSAAKITPPLNGFEFSGISTPFFVFCSVGAIYQGNGVLLTDDVSKNDMKEYAGKSYVFLTKKLTVNLESFVNVRFLAYDTKKEKTISVESQAIYVASEVGSFVQTECFSALTELTSQLDPTDGAAAMSTSVSGMFDAFAAKKWKKQK